MRCIFFFLLGTFLLIVQTSVFPALPKWLGKPDLLFILLIFLALRMPVFQGGVLTLLFGLEMDIFSGVFLGLYPLVYLILFFIVRWVSKILSFGDVAQQIPMMVASYLLMTSGIFIGQTLLAPKGFLLWSWPDVFLRMLILAIMAVPLFFLFDHFLDFFEERKMKWSFVKSRSKNRFASSGRRNRNTHLHNGEE